MKEKLISRWIAVDWYLRIQYEASCRKPLCHCSPPEDEKRNVLCNFTSFELQYENYWGRGGGSQKGEGFCIFFYFCWREDRPVNFGLIPEIDFIFKKNHIILCAPQVLKVHFAMWEKQLCICVREFILLIKTARQDQHVSFDRMLYLQTAHVQ